MGAIDEDYTEERLAEYDRTAIENNDVLVMGFVTLVRQLRDELTAERARTDALVAEIKTWWAPSGGMPSGMVRAIAAIAAARKPVSTWRDQMIAALFADYDAKTVTPKRTSAPEK